MMNAKQMLADVRRGDLDAHGNIEVEFPLGGPRTGVLGAILFATLTHGPARQSFDFAGCSVELHELRGPPERPPDRKHVLLLRDDSMRTLTVAADPICTPRYSCGEGEGARAVLSTRDGWYVPVRHGTAIVGLAFVRDPDATDGGESDATAHVTSSCDGDDGDDGDSGDPKDRPTGEWGGPDPSMHSAVFLPFPFPFRCCCCCCCFRCCE